MLGSESCTLVDFAVQRQLLPWKATDDTSLVRLSISCQPLDKRHSHPKPSRSAIVKQNGWTQHAAGSENGCSGTVAVHLVQQKHAKIPTPTDFTPKHGMLWHSVYIFNMHGLDLVVESVAKEAALHWNVRGRCMHRAIMESDVTAALSTAFNDYLAITVSAKERIRHAGRRLQTVCSALDLILTLFFWPLPQR